MVVFVCLNLQILARRSNCFHRSVINICFVMSYNLPFSNTSLDICSSFFFLIVWLSSNCYLASCRVSFRNIKTTIYFLTIQEALMLSGLEQGFDMAPSPTCSPILNSHLEINTWNILLFYSHFAINAFHALMILFKP